MLAELGTFALIMALCLAIIQSSFPIIGTTHQSRFLDGAGRIVVLGLLIYFAFNSRITGNWKIVLLAGATIPMMLLSGFTIAGVLGKYRKQTINLANNAWIARLLLLGVCAFAFLFMLAMIGMSLPLLTALLVALLQAGLTQVSALRRNIALNSILSLAVLVALVVATSKTISPAFVTGVFFSPSLFFFTGTLLITSYVCAVLSLLLVIPELCGLIRNSEKLASLERYFGFARMPLLITASLFVLALLLVGYDAVPNIISMSLLVLLIAVPLLHRLIYGYHFAALARSTGLGQFVFIALSFACLVALFVTDDFSVIYVAQNSKSALPLLFKVSAVWGAHEGSLVLWTLLLSGWTAAVVLFSKNLPVLYSSRIIAVMGLISIGFILFTLLTSNPFTLIYYEQVTFTQEFYTQLKKLLLEQRDPGLAAVLNKFGISVENPAASKFFFEKSAAELFTAFKDFNLDGLYDTARRYIARDEGKDLNPLLQDFGLAIHPPLLYMGYVGFSVAFSFAIASLMGGKLDSAWARWSRPWTTTAWIFLTIGIMLGSWWAYYELGWGGWWFWDPVENASFIPWLVGTALIHSLAVTEKRGTFQSWTVILAIIAFSLSLLGTFLVRSGVLNSVHAFSSDPARGIFILVFLIIVVGGSLILYAFQAPKIKSVGRFATFSKESLLLLNNVILVVVAAVVLWGTLYPIISNAVQHQSISVGPPWFNRYFVPLMLALSVVAALGPIVNWKMQRPEPLIRRILPYAITSLVIGVICFFASKTVTLFIAMNLTVASWVLLLSLDILIYRIRKMKSLERAFNSMTASSIGTMLAHIGVAVFIVGATYVAILTVKKDIKLAPGQSYTVYDTEFRFVSTRFTEGPNYNAYEARFDIFKDGKKIATVYPQKRFYLTKRQPMTEAGIDAGLGRDLLVSMGNPLNGYVEGFFTQPKHELTQPRRDHVTKLLKTAPWPITIQYKPLMIWVWLAAVIMALGGLIAILDKRYRLFSKKTSPGILTDEPAGNHGKPAEERK